MVKPSTRKAITPGVQASVLLKSRRRCCICYGLNRDTALKAGQIAHIDHDNSNNAEGNLVFLCFEHHDHYDSKTSQSKNFTESEVKHHLKELTKDIQSAFSQPVFFGSVKSSIVKQIEGQYTRVEGSGGEIRLTALPVSPNRFHISGLALWSENEESEPHLGQLDFSADLADGKLELLGLSYNEDYKIVIYVSENQLDVEEEGYLGVHGINVTFSGRYIKDSL